MVIAIFITISISFVYNNWTQAEVSDIFQIRCSSQSDDSSSTLTGFCAEGITGIVTALHGVAGCKKLSAIQRHSDRKDVEFNDLNIIKVDIDRDVALLSSKFKREFSSKGLVIGPKQTHRNKKISIVGYPLGIDEQLCSRKLRIRDRPRRTLYSLIPPGNIRKSLKKRKSPNLDKEVLSIEGHLAPGHSGAPILDEYNQVIGVADGGLQEGKGEIVWAIPWHDIEWKSYSEVKNDIENLEKLARAILFGLFVMPNGTTLQWQESKVRYMKWNEARRYAEKSKHNGYNDWKLPTIGELKELAAFIKTNPGVYSDNDLLYWSDEEQGPNSIQAYVVNLGNAEMNWYDTDKQVVERPKNKKFAVRLVRRNVTQGY